MQVCGVVSSCCQRAVTFLTAYLLHGLTQWERVISSVNFNSVPFINPNRHAYIIITIMPQCNSLYVQRGLTSRCRTCIGVCSLQ